MNTIADSHRHLEVNTEKTRRQVEKYYGKLALLATWEEKPKEIQANEHEYLQQLRSEIRVVRNYLLHRAGPDADIT